MDSDDWIAVASALTALVWIGGAASAVHAVMTPRSPQGAIAWGLSLLGLPPIAMPLYWIFGRPKFYGYVEARSAGTGPLPRIASELREALRPFETPDDELGVEYRVLERLARLPFTDGNRARLLVDGEATFDALFEGIAEAQRYVLAQFYILRDDRIGRKFVEALRARAAEGIEVCILYDEIGCGLSDRKIEELRSEGIRISGFKATKGRFNRFQLNFRNHRKLMVVDGATAFLGGINVGDEYLGRHERLTPWRDTFVRLDGPAALGAQLSFLEDWSWATETTGDWSWTPRPAPGVEPPDGGGGGKLDGVSAFVLPSGPADELETCALCFDHAFHSARKRIWLTTPYFVPDDTMIHALKLAALRGVDVRILLPGMTDMKLAKLAGFSYIEETLRPGIKMYRFRDGFLHQKVMLIDDHTASVGTANFDNRSFRLNFEITAVVVDRAFAAEVERMLLRDLERSEPIRGDELAKRPFGVRVASRAARLLAPVL